MKIAVLYVCTGKYEKFWDGFYESCEKYFYPEAQKHYFVFTESQRINTNKSDNVSVIYQVRSGWPYDTLLRFHWFAMVQDRLNEYDYCYFMNANSVFKKQVTEDIIPLPCEKEPLIFWCHTANYDCNNSDEITTETNPESTAYVGPNKFCRCYGGGFFGGTAQAFLKMTLELRDNIQSDLNKGIIAVWHDQSHIIKYGSSHPHKEVGRDLICQQERNPVEEKCVMVYLAKELNGGVDNLRYNGVKKRTKHKIIKVYSKMLKVLSAAKLDKPLRKLASLFKNRSNWYR